MESETYPLIVSVDGMTFRFISRGPRGNIPKVIQFDLLYHSEDGPMYNLAFGDGVEFLNDLTVSSNGDTDKVLATVAIAAELFFRAHPTALLYAIGSTTARTRLYRIGFTRFLSRIQPAFLLFGIVENEPELFEPGRPYEAFVIQRNSAYPHEDESV